MILGIILITIGLLGFACGTILLLETGDMRWVLLIYVVLLVIPGVVILFSKPHKVPTKQDVLDGKAIYQETQMVANNDTIDGKYLNNPQDIELRWYYNTVQYKPDKIYKVCTYCTDDAEGYCYTHCIYIDD